MHCPAFYFPDTLKTETQQCYFRFVETKTSHKIDIITLKHNNKSVRHYIWFREQIDEY